MHENRNQHTHPLDTPVRVACYRDRGDFLYDDMKAITEQTHLEDKPSVQLQVIAKASSGGATEKVTVYGL